MCCRPQSHTRNQTSAKKASLPVTATAIAAPSSSQVDLPLLLLLRMDQTIVSLQTVQSCCHPCQQHSTSLHPPDTWPAEPDLSRQLVCHDRTPIVLAAAHSPALLLPHFATDLQDFQEECEAAAQAPIRGKSHKRAAKQASLQVRTPCLTSPHHFIATDMTGTFCQLVSAVLHQASYAEQLSA